MQLQKFYNKGCLILALVLFSVLPATADQMGSSTFGFSLDLPEGFVVTENTGDGRATSFSINFALHKLSSGYTKQDAISLHRLLYKIP